MLPGVPDVPSLKQNAVRVYKTEAMVPNSKTRQIIELRENVSAPFRIVQ